MRDGNVSIPTSEKVLREGDRLLVVTQEKDVPALTVLFGEQEHTDWNKEDIDWNAIDSQLVSQRIVVTRSELNGKELGSLHLRNTGTPEFFQLLPADIAGGSHHVHGNRLLHSQLE